MNYELVKQKDNTSIYSRIETYAISAIPLLLTDDELYLQLLQLILINLFNQILFTVIKPSIFLYISYLIH